MYSNLAEILLNSVPVLPSSASLAESSGFLQDSCRTPASPAGIGGGTGKYCNFINNSEFLFVEKELATIGSLEDIYGCSDTLISKESPFVYVSNFSRKQITIPAGQALSQGWDPSSWLERERQFLKKERTAIQAHANLLRSIVTLEENATGRNPFVQTAKSEVKFLQDWWLPLFIIKLR